MNFLAFLRPRAREMYVMHGLPNGLRREFFWTLGLTVAAAGATLLGPAHDSHAEAIRGHYMEARTCQVYTGPCFANGEVGMAGKDAVMAWKIQDGAFEGVSLEGLCVALVVRADRTLAHQGFEDADKIRSMILVDAQADANQRAALIGFVRSQSAKATKDVTSVKTASMHLSLDVADLTGALEIENFVTLKTRQARKGDCICSNESAFYPPLTQLSGSVPGVTIEGEIAARSLGTRWSIPDSRTAYMGTFETP